MWSRRALLDVSIEDGSMIAYTKRAISLGFAVIICNPNEVFWYKGKGVIILPKANVEFDSIPDCEYNEYVTTSVIDRVFDFFMEKLSMPDNWREAMMLNGEEESGLEQLDNKAQKSFEDDLLVNDVQDKIHYYMEKSEGSNSGWD
ncbi:11769_t:CDS:2 [Acaulospora colombiana]|uniref:11769_t:CDS:1 n=1 Tax=Acaulospora colombiana TaxID=27376 RepID=A0ACA9M1Q7_9GLOM|nr:11769_t:CDS:2 [Acaulospora colombiana]